MASQPVSVSASYILEIDSFVRGYHAYQDIWQPTVGDILPLRREPSNDKDSLAVSIIKNGNIVGHMPCNLAPLVSYFLMREVNKGLVELTGEKINRGAGMGLELPCIYRLYGPRPYLDRLEAMIMDGAAPSRLRLQHSSDS